MSAPKFAVGEVVILQSKALPGLNGEYQVLGVMRPGESAQVDGAQKKNNSSRPGYDLGIRVPGHSGWWVESTLRKRHQPGEHTFGGLMAALNAPVSRDQLARLDREVSHG